MAMAKCPKCGKKNLNTATGRCAACGYKAAPKRK